MKLNDRGPWLLIPKLGSSVKWYSTKQHYVLPKHPALAKTSLQGEQLRPHQCNAKERIMSVQDSKKGKSSNLCGFQINPGIQIHYWLPFTLSLRDTKQHSRLSAPLLGTIPSCRGGGLMLHSSGLDAGVGALLASLQFRLYRDKFQTEHHYGRNGGMFRMCSKKYSHRNIFPSHTGKNMLCLCKYFSVLTV